MNNLQQAVIEQLGYTELDEECISTLKDVSNYGAGGGYGQFVYHTDTVKFAEDNLSDIKSHLKDMADNIGSDGIYSLIASFTCIDLNVDHVADTINDPESDDYTQVMNALAWYALEETARELTNN